MSRMIAHAVRPEELRAFLEKHGRAVVRVSVAIEYVDEWSLVELDGRFELPCSCWSGLPELPRDRLNFCGMKATAFSVTRCVPVRFAPDQEVP